tara:strand:+ start:296 stop:643 length:348 start_codon:yes stop_codon:yes gene_type:complete
MPRRRFCFCGDLFIWAAPNAGNPQKVQRYPEEWALNARKIAALRPRIVFPGHGPPIIGKFRFCILFNLLLFYWGVYYWKLLLEVTLLHTRLGTACYRVPRTSPAREALYQTPRER